MPYSDTYDAITDVPVVTGATLSTSLHDGDEYILIFNEALWMGNTQQHTLVNPIQLQAYGTTLQDNPFASSPLKFEPPTSPIIPLTTMGTIIYCNTHTPSDHELSTPPHIPLSSPVTWDPHNVVFPTHCVEGENTSRRFHRFHQFPHLQTSPQQYIIPSPSTREWFLRYKSMPHQNLLMSYLLR